MNQGKSRSQNGTSTLYFERIYLPSTTVLGISLESVVGSLALDGLADGLEFGLLVALNLDVVAPAAVVLITYLPGLSILKST